MGQYKRRSMHPMAIESRRRRRYYRRQLIQMLGGKCKKCGSDKKLEPHHTQPRTWSSREKWAMSRLLIYLKEAKLGLVILLCSTCNKIAGAPDFGDVDHSDF